MTTARPTDSPSLAADSLPPANPTRKVLLLAVKNEAPFLVEWIAYHKLIGFDDIVICSNPSNDGTEELLGALAEAGVVRHLRTVPEPGEPAQSAAARCFGTEIGYRDGDWYLWLDADEFLNIHVGARRIDDLIEAVGAHDCALINWRVFGASGNATFPGRFVSEAFGRAARQRFAGNVSVKSFFRKSPKFAGFATVGIHRPLVKPGGGLRPADVITGAGTNPSVGFRPHLQWLRGESFPANSGVDASEIGWSLAQVNHYMVRTPEHFLLKRLRGRGWKADSEGAANQRHTDSFFAKYDRNEQEDRSILHWDARVTEKIAELMQIPAVAAAQRRSDEMVHAVFAEIKAMGETPPPAGSANSSATSAGSPVAGAELPLPFPPKVANRVLKLYEAASAILEYGSGGSTLAAARMGKTITSVECDKSLAARLSASLAGARGRATVHLVDIGPTSTNGMPTDSRFFKGFHAYPLSVWDRNDLGEPDLVLIDGRFRKACLAAVRLRAKRKTTVLFDDYAIRDFYHEVEKLVPVEETIGRMARFSVTPGPIPPELMTEVIGWFADSR